MSETASLTPRWLTLSQARAYSSLGRNLLKKLADTGQVRAGWTGGSIGKGHRRWDRESLDAYLTRGDDKIVAMIKDMGI